MSTLMEPVHPDFIDSQSHRALQNAFYNEEQTRQLYLHAAPTMEEAQLHVIAHMLRFTAAQEKEHAAIFAGLISTYGGQALSSAEEMPLPAGGPADILRAFAQAESCDAQHRYPEAARIALAEGYPRIAAAFQRIAETEALHAQRFHRFEHALISGTLFQESTPVSWLCLPCGQFHTGCEPPESCPSCNRDRGHFIRSNYYPFHVEG